MYGYDFGDLFIFYVSVIVHSFQKMVSDFGHFLQLCAIKVYLHWVCTGCVRPGQRLFIDMRQRLSHFRITNLWNIEPFLIFGLTNLRNKPFFIFD